jgi:hypothetical protein
MSAKSRSCRMRSTNGHGPLTNIQAGQRQSLAGRASRLFRRPEALSEPRQTRAIMRLPLWIPDRRLLLCRTVPRKVVFEETNQPNGMR